MDKNVKVIVIIMLLAMLLLGAHSVYKGISGQYQSDSLSEIGGTKSSAENGSEEAGQTEAPDFTVVDAEGAEVKLSDFEGKPVVLNFWASWCGPCKSEMPMFQQMYETYGEELTFVMVNLTDGSRETKDSAQAYIEEAGYTFPVYFDVDSEAIAAYYVNSVPVTYFIDAEGNLRAYGEGAMDEEIFRQGLDMLGILQ